MERELVIARFRESISWLLDTKIATTIYNHGDTIDLDRPNIDVLDIPNVPGGREAHCWLSHIVRNYNHLADWTYFIQADPSPHISLDELWKRVDLNYQDTTPLVTRYLDHFPAQKIKDCDLVEMHQGYEIRWGDASLHGNRTPEENRAWVTATWLQYFSSPQPETLWFPYCAMMAVPRYRIVQRPLRYWRWILDLVENGKNVEQTPTSAWGQEIIFGYLFGDSNKYRGHIIPDVPAKVEKKGCGCSKDRPKISRR